MSEQTNIPSTANTPNGDASARVRERALVAKRLAAAAQRLVPAHGTDAQRAAVQDAQVASLMADEALAAVSEDEALAVAMAEEASTLAIESLKAAQAAVPEPVPAHAAPVAKPAPAHAVPKVEPEHAVPEVEPAQVAPVAEPVSAHVEPEPTPAPAPEPADAPAPTQPAHAPAPAAVDTPAIPTKPSHKLRTVCIALAGVLLVMAALVAGAWFGLFRLPEPIQERIYLLPDAHAQAGRLNAAETEVAPGSFQLALNQLCTMAEGSLDCPIQFENPAANQYSARIVLEADGQQLARSGMVAPGSYVSTLRLDHALEPGDHEVRAMVLVYSGATQVNTLSNSVTVRVK